MGNAVPTNQLYTNVKTLLERVAPVMIDNLAITALVEHLHDAITGTINLRKEVPDIIEKGMKLLLVRYRFVCGHSKLSWCGETLLFVVQVLAMVYQGAFQDEEIYQRLIAFVKNNNEVVCKIDNSTFLVTSLSHIRKLVSCVFSGQRLTGFQLCRSQHGRAFLTCLLVSNNLATVH